MKLPAARNENIVVQNLEKETLIYDLTLDTAYCLNETASLVFNACDGKTDFTELKQKHRFTDDLIYLTLEDLQRKGFLKADAKVLTPFNNLSRREVVRRVGLGSLVALPVILSIIAPQAAHAASFARGSRTLRQSCNTSTDCASGAPNCTNTPQNSGQHICCVGSDSRFDTGGVVNSCSGGNCSSQTFACQDDAGSFCCSGAATASCTGNSCACRCN